MFERFKRHEMPNVSRMCTIGACESCKLDETQCGCLHHEHALTEATLRGRRALKESANRPCFCGRDHKKMGNGPELYDLEDAYRL